MAVDEPQPELIPYATVAHGTGRTPVGIILFAAAHLLMGGFCLLVVGRWAAGHSIDNSWMKFFAICVVVGALCMIGGGATLLMKGQGAWIASLSAFAWLAVCEAAVAAMGVGWWLLPRGRGLSAGYVGAMLAAVATALFALCVIVLGYLGSSRARDTFALPPGETPATVRILPRAAMAVFLIAVMLACR